MNVHKTTFKPSMGDVIELPEQIGRKDSYRFGGGNGSQGHFETTVVGTGEMVEYVVLRMDEDEGTLAEGSEILGSDVHRNCLFYAVPRSAYGGDA